MANAKNSAMDITPTLAELLEGHRQDNPPKTKWAKEFREYVEGFSRCERAMEMMEEVNRLKSILDDLLGEPDPRDTFGVHWHVAKEIKEHDAADSFAVPDVGEGDDVPFEVKVPARAAIAAVKEILDNLSFLLCAETMKED